MPAGEKGQEGGMKRQEDLEVTHKNARQFFALTPDVILKSAEKTGLCCTGRCLFLNSLENRVCELELDLDLDEAEGRSARSNYERFRVLKFYRPGRWSREQIAEEHEFLSDLKAEGIPVICPEQRPDVGSLWQCEGEGIWFAVFPKAGGRIEYETDDQKISMLGRYLARIHIVGRRRKAHHRPKMDLKNVGESNLDWLVTNQLIPPDLESGYRRSVESILSMAAPEFAHTDAQRIHGDCHLGNVLWNEEQPLWLDFDDMVIGPCVQDIWLLAPNRDEEGLRQRELFLKAYESLVIFDRGSLRLIEILRAMRYLHYNAWIGRRWSDPSFKKAFPDYGSWQYWSLAATDMQNQEAVIRQELQKSV